jgi:hypothetical protein
MAEQGVADGGHLVDLVLGGGGDADANGVPVRSDLFRTPSTGEVPLALGRAEAAFAQFVKRENVQVVGQTQHIGLAVA